MIALDPTTGWRVIDNFKKEEYAILFENMPFDQSGSVELLKHEYTMNGLEWLKARLKSAELAYSEKKERVTERRMSLEEAIIAIDNSINDTYVDIKKTEKSLEEKNTRIAEYQSMSSDLALRIRKNRETILGYLANIYSESNTLYDSENKVDIIQAMILSPDTPDSISTDIVYKSLVSILGQKFIDEYRSLVRDYYRMSIRIRDEVNALEEAKALLEKQKSTLAVQRNQREDLLDATKGQEALYDEYIEAQKKAQEAVEKSWQEQSDAYNLSLDGLLQRNGCTSEKKTGAVYEKCVSIRNFYKNESELKKMTSSDATTNTMSWPLAKVSSISAYFRDPSYFRAVGSQHDAIDIPAPQGTDVLAAQDGYVYYVLPPSPGGYSYLALKHPNGYVTVYGHLSEIRVSPYQFVKKWDPIAKSGWAPGTPGAWPMTSGAHLHFEVFHNQEPLDPLRVLDTSVLSYDDIPSRYQDKFIADFLLHNWPTADISDYERKFKMKGDTEEERQKYLLSTYATRDFRNWDTWVNTALDAQIDPSFLMCVWLAETTLGNYLKTPYNIGNVGNTDSGSTYEFASPREGIEWMVATFNNKYLSQYTHVSELSRWGNSDGPIYASSNANWHNNIIRCLSSLKGRFVEDDFNFRIR